jgi:hypothetical protein
MSIYQISIFQRMLDVESLYKTVDTSNVDLNFTALDHAPACIQINSTLDQKFYAFCFDDRRKVQVW